MATLKKTPIKSTIGKRWQVVVEWRKTKGDKDFVKHLTEETGLSKHIVRHALDLYKTTLDVVDDPRPGRPHAIQPVETQALAKQVAGREGKRGILAGQSATRMSKRVPGSKKDGSTKPVAVSTLTRRLREDASLEYRRALTRHMIAPTNANARLEFCRQHRDISWKHVMFIDSKIAVMRPGVYGTRFRFWMFKDKPLAQPITQEHQQVHVYGGVGWEGRTMLHAVTGTTGMRSPYMKKIRGGKEVPHVGVCAQEVIDLFRDKLLAEIKSIFQHTHKGTWCAAMDRCSSHKSAHSTLAEMGIRFLDWPAQGQDLSPIENVWSWLEYHLHLHDYANLDEFRQRMDAIWNTIDTKLLHHWCGSMHKRMRLCIQANGYNTGY
jgi:hypothetical protein